MHYLVILLCVCISYTQCRSNEPFVLNRVQIIKNPMKQASVRMHGQSPEMPLLHAILRFSSPINQPHNALLIDKSSIDKFSKILVERESKIIVSSRNVKKLLSYHTVDDNRTSDSNGDGIADKISEAIRESAVFGGGALSATVSYDGVLLLDSYSALWNGYNVMVFSPSLLTFSYTVNGSLSDSLLDYTEMTRFSCEASFESDHCLVVSQDHGLEVNGHFYADYRVVIDLDTHINLLPINLYLTWMASESRSLRIRLSNDSQLVLNRHFTYDMHQSNILVLGIELIHHFPRIEYSLTQKTFQLFYYDTVESHEDRQYTVKVLFMVLNVVLLVCLFRWGTSYNYQILHYMIEFAQHARHSHYFGYKQVLYELLAILVSIVVIIVSFLVTDTPRLFVSTDYETRKRIFTLSLLYNIAVALYIIFVKHREPLLALYRQLVLRQKCATPSTTFGTLKDRDLAKRLRCAVVKLYNDPIIRTDTPLVITRNGTFITLILTALQLLFNFYTQENNIYLVLIVALSLALLYFHVKYIGISIVYLSLFYPCYRRLSVSQRTTNKWFTALIVLNVLTTGIGIYSVYDSIYFAYFNTINSTHSFAIITVYVITVIATLVLVAIMIVITVFDKYADPIIERALERRSLLLSHH